VDYFPVAWSLAIEFWFYLLVPLLLLNRVAKKNTGRQLLYLCCSIIVILFIGRLIYVEGVKPGWEFGVHRFIPLRFDTLVFGVIAAVITRQHKRLHMRLTSPSGLVVGIALCAGFCVWFGRCYYQGSFNGAIWMQSIGLSMLGLESTLFGLSLYTYPC